MPQQGLSHLGELVVRERNDPEPASGKRERVHGGEVVSRLKVRPLQARLARPSVGHGLPQQLQVWAAVR